MSGRNLLITMILSALVTFSLRAVPFVLFGRKKEAPELIRRLGDLLPYAVIAALVVYCLKDIPSMEAIENIKLFGAVVAVVAIHLWKKNSILSIAVGTAFYMFLLHI